MAFLHFSWANCEDYINQYGAVFGDERAGAKERYAIKHTTYWCIYLTVILLSPKSFFHYQVRSLYAKHFFLYKPIWSFDTHLPMTFCGC